MPDIKPATAMLDSLASGTVKCRLAAQRSLQHVTEEGIKAKGWVVANPVTALAAGAGTALIIAPMAVAAPALGVAGFGVNGVVGGSLAAAAQSGIGNVIAPSVFATFTSAGAGGYGVATVAGVVQGVGGIVTSGAAVSAIRRKLFGAKQHGGDDKNPDSDEKTEQDEDRVEDDEILEAKI